MGANLLYLKGGTKDHFMGFLASEHPRLLDGYNRLYPRAHAPAEYVSAVRATIDALQKRYEVNRRATRVAGGPRDLEQNDAAEQKVFEWADESAHPMR